MAMELGDKFSLTAMQGILKRNAPLKDDLKISVCPNFYLIREFGVDPDSCRDGVEPITLDGSFLRAEWRDVWTVSDPGGFAHPCEQLVAKYLWTLDWYWFWGKCPLRADDEETKSMCSLLGLSPDNLHERGNAPLRVLTHEKLRYFLRLSENYLKDKSLSGCKKSNPEEVKRERKRRDDEKLFYKKIRFNLLTHRTWSKQSPAAYPSTNDYFHSIPLAVRGSDTAVNILPTGFSPFSHT